MPSEESLDNLLKTNHMEYTATDKTEISFSKGEGDEDDFALNVDNIKVTSKNKEDAKKFLEFTTLVDPAPSDIADICDRLKTPPKTISEELASGLRSFAVLFLGEASHLEKLVGLEGIKGTRILISTDAALAEKLGTPFPGLYSYDAEEKYSFSSALPESAQALRAVLSIGLFPRFDEKVSEYIHYLPENVFCIVDKSWNYEKTRARCLDAMKRNASKDAKFVFFSTEQMRGPMKKLKLSEEHLPLVIAVIGNKKHVIKNADVEHFDKVVEDVLAGNCEFLRYVADLPEDNEKRDVKVLNTLTIDDFLKNTALDRMLTFFLPSCPHCVSLAPRLVTLAQALKEKNVSIAFAEYDIMENEPVEGHTVDSVPKIFFVPQGSERMVEVLVTAHEIDNLLNFIYDNGRSAKFDLLEMRELIKQKRAGEDAHGDFSDPASDEDSGCDGSDMPQFEEAPKKEQTRKEAVPTRNERDAL